jgi:phenylacetate-CoA ligase
MLAWMDAAMWAGYAWHGIGPGDKRLRFWGLSPAPVRRLVRRLADRVTGQIRFSAFEISAERCVRFFTRARRSGARYAYGYPTLMKRWASECSSAGLDGRELALQCVISTGEVLTPLSRRELATFFGCPIINEYGCTESGVIAIECEHGTPHMIPVAAKAEVVDQGGRRVPPGGTGQVVVSDLFGTALPMLRYRLHDLARALDGSSCPCGRTLPAIDVTIGREGSFILLPSGRQVFSTILAYTVPASIASYRARQETADLLRADVTLQSGTDPAAAIEAAQAAWGEALGREIRIEINVVSDLPFEPSGKLRYFVPLGSRQS